MDQEPDRPSSPATGGQLATAAAVAAAAATGWGLVDLSLYGASTEPDQVLALLPGTLAAVALAAVLGALARGRTGALVLLALLAGASLGARSLGLETRAELWLPRAALLILALGTAARAAGRALPRLDPTLLALFGGALVAGLLARRWGVRTAETYVVPAVLAAALLHRTLRAPRPSPAAWVALVVLAAHVAGRGYFAVQLRRPDLPPPEPSAAAPSRGERPNLLLVVLDTVRADHLAPYGHDRVTTPFLDAFVARYATVHTQARSSSSWTLPSHASLLTGLHPDVHGATRPRSGDDPAGLALQAWPARRLRPDARTLAQELRDRGYRTGALLGNTSFLRHEFGLDRGFERYDDRTGVYWPDHLSLAQLGGGLPRVGGLIYREARVISDLALDWLSEREEEPFFLLLNYMDAHSPYLPPASTAGLFAPQRPADPRHPPTDLHPLLYDRELAYLDRELARVLDRLERDGRLRNTVVIVTSDHGEAFGEHDFRAHGWNLYEEVVHVPLYVKSAHGDAPPAPARDARPLRGMDVFALALHELGFGPPPAGGEELGSCYLTPFLARHWSEKTGHPVPSALTAWLSEGTKWIASADGIVEAYDLGADPGELTPRDLTPEAAEAARARARAWWQAHPVPEAEPMEALDAENLGRLRGLGYFGADH